MTLPTKLYGQAVVAVNVYEPGPPIFVGHMNVTFYHHGINQGTFGYNSTGTDIAGKHHTQSFPSPNMHGGVFRETNEHAKTHFVVVSERNYQSKYAYAMSEAQLTTGRNNIRYMLARDNCADFVYRLFQHTDLTPEQKDVKRYLQTTSAPAAMYAALSSDDYMKKNIHDPQKLMDFNLSQANKSIAAARK